MYVASIEQNVIHLPKLRSCWQHSSAEIAEWHQIFFWWPVDNIKLGALRERSIKRLSLYGSWWSSLCGSHEINLPYRINLQ